MPPVAWTAVPRSITAAHKGQTDYIFYIGTTGTVWFFTIDKSNPRAIKKTPAEVRLNVPGNIPIRLPEDGICQLAAALGPNNYIHLFYPAPDPNTNVKFLAETYYDDTDWQPGTIQNQTLAMHQNTTLTATNSTSGPLMVYFLGITETMMSAMLKPNNQWDNWPLP